MTPNVALAPFSIVKPGMKTATRPKTQAAVAYESPPDADFFAVGLVMAQFAGHANGVQHISPGQRPG